MTESGMFFKPLIQNLRDSKIDSTRIQICRAIGNLCYYNDDGRHKLLKIDDSIDIFIDLLKQMTAKSEENEQLVEVLLGCLHNITNENDALKKEFCDKNIFSYLKDLLHIFNKSVFSSSKLNTFKYYLSIVENLLEIEEFKEKFTTESFIFEFYSSLNKNFILSINDYYEELFQFLELINTLKDSKKQLCKSTFLETLISIIEIKEADKELVKFCGLFLTTLLTDDEDVNEVFEYKNRFILTKAIEWLNAEFSANNDPLYLISSVVIANYTRSDKDVETLMNNPVKPHEKILNILKQMSTNQTSYSSDTEKLEKANVAHSLLGALRNFCIATNYRNQLINEHIIDVVLPFILTSPLDDVKYKAIGIIRLVIKNCSNEYELIELCKEEILQNFIQTRSSSDHAGVKGELSRLICYLLFLSIKYPKLSLIENLTKLNAFDIIIDQLKSEHSIMVNEALLSLNICVNFSYHICSEKLKESKLNEIFEDLIKRENLPAEVNLNSLKLFTCLLQKDHFTEQQIELYEKVLKTKLTDTGLHEAIRAYIGKIIEMIDKKN